MRAPKFIYFDLGKVIVDFSVERMCRQMAEAAGTTTERARRVLFDEGLQQRAELGRINEREFYAAFCRRIGTHADFDALRTAACDIFEIKPDVLPLVAQLAQAGYRLGILSNTCPSHWEYCRRRYRIVSDAFAWHALSFEIGAAKPAAPIYQAAARIAGAAPAEIFFVDDLPENVAGAQAAGFDAVRYTTPAELAQALRVRGVRMNY